MLVVCLSFLSSMLVFAQNIEKTKKIGKDEVPAVVQNSLEKGFSISPNDGTWTLNYSENGTAGQAPTLKVESYTFRQKKDGNKVVIYFSPEGVVEHSRGVSKTSSGD